MIARRGLLFAGWAASFAASPTVRAQPRVRRDWLGYYAGAASFHGSLPLEDIYPPPAHPHVDHEDPAPIRIRFAVSGDANRTTTWLRIDGGPMETGVDGETLRFGPTKDGVAALAEAQARPAPRSASLTAQADSLAIEALFAFADGSFWRRHFTVRFTPPGGDVIIWVFDAAGTRARTWRGSVLRQLQLGRGPT